MVCVPVVSGMGPTMVTGEESLRERAVESSRISLISLLLTGIVRILAELPVPRVMMEPSMNGVPETMY